MSARYPVMLDASRLRVLVVGGGEVALRKVRGLVEAGGRPEVIAPEIHPELREMVEAHGLAWTRRPYEEGDAHRFDLVFAATDAAEVNAQVAAEAAADRGLVDVADDPRASTFHLPSVIRQGDLVVAMSTGGASPLLARRLRECLEERVVTSGLGRAAERLAALRREVRQRWPDDEPRRRAAWFDLITPEFLDAAIAGRDDEVEHRISACLSQS